MRDEWSDRFSVVSNQCPLSGLGLLTSRLGLATLRLAATLVCAVVAASTFAQTPANSTDHRLLITDHSSPPTSNSLHGMVWIPGGEFSMGADEPEFRDARPWHRVHADGFRMDKTEVTTPNNQDAG
jgi:formylglycine-generating enzyme required for sulfatase activity